MEIPGKPGEFMVRESLHVALPSPRSADRSNMEQSAPPIDGALIVNAGDFMMRCEQAHIWPIFTTSASDYDIVAKGQTM